MTPRDSSFTIVRAPDPELPIGALVRPYRRRWRLVLTICGIAWVGALLAALLPARRYTGRLLPDPLRLPLKLVLATALGLLVATVVVAARGDFASGVAGPVDAGPVDAGPVDAAYDNETISTSKARQSRGVI